MRMKRVLSINNLPNGSTGKIMIGINECAENNGYVCQAFYGNWSNCKIDKSNVSCFGNKMENMFHALIGKQLGKVGQFSYFGTRSLIAKIENFAPDIIHLHNIHLWVINFPLLFKYLSKKKIRIVWTLHDCWSFTGHCPYFTLCNCERWKVGCYDCPQLNRYPFAMIDSTKENWELKKKLFTSIDNLTIVTPSNWLASLVKESFLCDSEIRVINNGIDTNVFQPYDKVIAKNKYRVPNDSFIILGVAYEWEVRKGLDIFLKLAEVLDKSLFTIILVGTNKNIDKILPGNIMSIHRTNNQLELAEIYSMADIYLNPTREENYPTVNLEAISCGTPVVTFNTGGSPEMLNDTNGIVIKSNSFEETLDVVYKIQRKKIVFDRTLIRAYAKKNDAQERFRDYVRLYDEMLAIDSLNK